MTQVAGSLTSRELEQWLEHAGPALERVRISGDFGRGPSLGRGTRGSTWISLASPWARARLVRSSDGASHWDAHRRDDSSQLLEGHSSSTSASQLDALVELLSGRAA